MRESMEEAGVRGTCVYVGGFKFKSRKKALNASGLKGGCLARVFGMDVTEEMTEWPEQKKRRGGGCRRRTPSRYASTTG